MKLEVNLINKSENKHELYQPENTISLYEVPPVSGSDENRIRKGQNLFRFLILKLFFVIIRMDPSQATHYCLR